MTRKKLPEGIKKKEFSVSINNKLDDKLDEYLLDKEISKSKYIANLVKEDMKERGENIEDDF